MGGTLAMSEKFQHITNALAELDEDALINGIEKAVEMQPGTEEAQEIVNACALGM